MPNPTRAVAIFGARVALQVGHLNHPLVKGLSQQTCI
jgi:hypothetical protein